MGPLTRRPSRRWPSLATARSWPRPMPKGRSRSGRTLEKLNSKSAALLTLKGHQGAINTVGFSSDGKRLVTTSADKTARVWDLENAGAAIRPLERSGNLSLVARFSPDGQLIAAAAGSSIASVGRRHGATRAGTVGRRQGSYPQRGILAHRQPPAGCGVRRSNRRFSCRAVGHRCRNGTGAVAGSDRSARLLGWTTTAGRSVRWRFRPMGNIWSPGFGSRDGCLRQQRILSQSAEGLGGRHAPTDPPPEWTHGLLCFSRLLAGTERCWPAAAATGRRSSGRPRPGKNADARESRSRALT